MWKMAVSRTAQIGHESGQKQALDCCALICWAESGKWLKLEPGSKVINCSVALHEPSALKTARIGLETSSKWPSEDVISNWIELAQLINSTELTHLPNSSLAGFGFLWKRIRFFYEWWIWLESNPISWHAIGSGRVQNQPTWIRCKSTQIYHFHLI